MDAPDDEEESFRTLIPGLSTHTSLKELVLNGDFLSSPAVLSSFVDQAITIGITALRLDFSGLGPRSTLQLARLLTRGQLSRLDIAVGDTEDDLSLLDMANERPAFDAFCAALQSNTSIQTLSLEQAGLWDDLIACDALTSALVGHRSIQHLNFQSNKAGNEENRLAVGTVLARLVATNTPCLRSLHLSYCGLGDEGIRPIVSVLRWNTHLYLFASFRNGLTPAFARDTLIPALAANASLRTLKVDHEVSVPELAQAEALVASRTQ